MRDKKNLQAELEQLQSEFTDKLSDIRDRFFKDGSGIIAGPKVEGSKYDIGFVVDLAKLKDDFINTPS